MAEVLERDGVRDGQPFILGPDGFYDLDLNRFLRELPSIGVRAENSIAAYAFDLTVFCRFLWNSRGGKRIWEVERVDALAFKQLRRSTPGFEVAASTWNRFVAVLDKLVFWALDEKLMQRAPFRYRELWVATEYGGKTVQSNGLRDPDEKPPVQFVCFEDFLLWRDVGLRGRLPDGRPDKSWRGRNAERNAAFADLLVHTGMRLGEACSVLVAELPELRADAGSPLNLSPAVTKRNKARTVWVDRRTLRKVLAYCDVEREALTVSRPFGPDRAGTLDLVQVVRAGSHGISARLDGQIRPLALSKIDTGLRERLYQVQADGGTEPLSLWLREDGRPMSRAGWQNVFARANERCARLGVKVCIHPHVLRHTFAVTMLGLLLRETIRHLGPHEVGISTEGQLKRLLLGSPLRKLQLLLGHKHIETTMIYLDYLDEAREIVLAALESWGDQAIALERTEVGQGEVARAGGAAA